MATWNYADYVTYTDDAERLTRLRLHIAEVSQRIVSVEARSSKVTPVEVSYLQQLKNEEQALIPRTESTSSGFARNYGRFRRE